MIKLERFSLRTERMKEMIIQEKFYEKSFKFLILLSFFGLVINSESFLNFEW
jgi:hypothetical protein